jgi:hypothetical protein
MQVAVWDTCARTNGTVMRLEEIFWNRKVNRDSP